MISTEAFFHRKTGQCFSCRLCSSCGGGLPRTVFSGCCSPVGLRTQAPRGSTLKGSPVCTEPADFSEAVEKCRSRCACHFSQAEEWCRARCPSWLLWGCSEPGRGAHPLCSVAMWSVWLGACPPTWSQWAGCKVASVQSPSRSLPSDRLLSRLAKFTFFLYKRRYFTCYCFLHWSLGQMRGP